ncbi:MAG: hypothetical protein QF904_00035 [Gemmatimonadota bacterium]|nr:hypothetical protein [Gemmatimonadota bacterium]
MSAGLALAVAVTSCGPPSPPPVDPSDVAAFADEPGANRCAGIPGSVNAGADLLFGTGSGVSAARAPVPANASEAVVFRHLYQTLTEVDCNGHVTPGLAREWHSIEDGRAWIFTLVPDVHYADGGLISAREVVNAWAGTRRRAQETGRGRTPWVGIHPEDMGMPGLLTLVIRPDPPRRDLPRLLSHPAFSVLHRVEKDEWPLSTTGWITDDRHESRGGGQIRWDSVSDGERGPSSVTFHVEPGADPRDLSRADAFLLRDGAAARYLNDAGGFRVVPLPADVRYDLLLPVRLKAAVVAALGEGALLDLATSVVRADARPAPPSEAAPPLSVRYPKRVRYSAEDADAARIAERLAALFAEAGGDTPVVEAIPAEVFPDAVARGKGTFVAPVSLRDVAVDGAWSSWPGASIPLVTTGAWMAVRDGVAGIVPGFDAVPRLRAAGREIGRQSP